ncbi:MAG: holo-ACP synthase [Clostridia bacterium]|nr:holo-ACP synthase [Clostridia bacterium]
MHIKTGIDIVEVNRIRKDIEEFGNKFLNRIFTKEEIEYCEGKKVQKFQSYAGRFAAKEAIFKAISACIHNKYDVEWKDIQITNDKNGRPVVKIYGKLKEVLTVNCEIDVSISHINETAVASAVVELKKGM